ncbi:hypothetical protein X734_24675 [Mesorhizobium sp. L2C084A000]|nr:hypothetical protein X734_24675 [Mesorhizobium sp. L2C084A000]
MVLLPAERTILTVALALVAVCMFLAWDKNVTLALDSYGFPSALRL